MTEVYPPMEYRRDWLRFRQEHHPHMYGRSLTVEATKLRDAIIRVLWDGECSYDQSAMAIWAAVDQLIIDGAWGPGRPDDRTG